MAIPYHTRANEIGALIAGVEGSGQVHCRVRTAKNWKDYIARFTDASKAVNAWQVSRKAAAGLRDEKWVETWSLIKLASVIDADESELAFQQNVDDVARMLLGAELSFGVFPEGMSIEEVYEGMFGDVLCHVGRCTLTVAFYHHQL
jgi:hypothetical protein